MGAVFGQKFGWERANWFVDGEMEQVDHWSFRRSKWFDAVGKEVTNVTNNVGVLDMTAFAKCRISGKHALKFLDNLLANKIPQKSGQIALCHALNSNGGIHSRIHCLKGERRIILSCLSRSTSEIGS